MAAVDGIEKLIGGLGRAVAVIDVVRADARALENGLAQLGWSLPPGNVALVELMTLDAANVVKSV